MYNSNTNSLIIVDAHLTKKKKVLCAIRFIDWFYSFSLNFCTKFFFSCEYTGRPNPTRLARNPFKMTRFWTHLIWPATWLTQLDLTVCHVFGLYDFGCNIWQNGGKRGEIMFSFNVWFIYLFIYCMGEGKCFLGSHH